MSTELVLHSPDEAFSLADRISRSNLVPTAYRGKPVEMAVAMMYGAEIGLPPMTSLNRIVVVEGKPALDAQGMVAVIRAQGHSLSGESSATRAVVKGTRKDTGDSITAEFTIDEARAAGLANKDNWKHYPKAMLWARAVSQLARMLFADCLMGFSYTPEEADFDGRHQFDEDGRPVDAVAAAGPLEQGAAVERPASADVPGEVSPAESSPPSQPAPEPASPGAMPDYARMDLKELTGALSAAELSLQGTKAAKVARLEEWWHELYGSTDFEKAMESLNAAAEGMEPDPTPSPGTTPTMADQDPDDDIAEGEIVEETNPEQAPFK